MKPEPLFPNHKRRLQRRRKIGYMTIAAGIQFNGGVLLCADSQYTSPTVKFFDSKISEANMADSGSESDAVNVVIAMSGTDGYMQTAVSECESAISDWAFDKKMVSTSVESVIEKALLKVFQKHIYNHPHYGYTHGPGVELLVAVWHESGNAALFRTNETTVTRVNFFDACAFVGSGQDLARYATVPLIQPVFRDVGMNLDEAILLATHALRVAKQNDPNCGGWSDFSVLYDNGTVSSVVSGREIDITERYSETFEQIIRTLFFSVADLDSRLAKGALTLSNKQIAAIRKEQRKMIEQRRTIADLLKPRPKRGSGK